ncbi:MAG: LysM peptidoglycan-binding domain-containing M23 family metallopeptidase [Leptospirales bacterium]|nr:LysM peptidoglycan-binding domain-containing M23 family metallopeptidase [Leptospirales bacterium]
MTLSAKLRIAILVAALVGLPYLSPGAILANARDGSDPESFGQPNLLKVYVDNGSIQSYRGRLGQWIAPGGEALSAIARRYGVSVDEIREVNGGNLSGPLVFAPMSLEMYDRLVSEGRGRREVEIDRRKFLWPVEEPHYTSRYGNRRGGMHTGLDMGCAPNTVVVAAADGVVVDSGWYGALGQAIAIQHDNDLVTWYGHNNRLLARVGERVKRGQAIALSGSTGRSTGPHVHFEVRFLGVAMNPEDFLQFGFTQPALVLREESPLDNEVEGAADAGGAASESRLGN